MINNDIIDVEYVLYTTNYSIRNLLPKVLSSHKTLSFDCETRSLYTAEEREAAKEYLKDVSTTDSLRKHAMVVAESSGLSYPSIIRTTHFMFGESKSKSHVIVCDSQELEMFLWGLVADYKGKLIIWNACFDLKICFQRTGKLPINYVDGMLMVKGLINHVDIWKSKTGLKGIMGDFYDIRWALMNDYEPENLKDKTFLKYCATDASATYFANELIIEKYNEFSTES